MPKNISLSAGGFFRNYISRQEQSTKEPLSNPLNAGEEPQQDRGYSLSVSDEARNLLFASAETHKNTNETLDKFYEAFGIDRNAPVELIAQDATPTEAELREKAKRNAELPIARDAQNLLDAFHGGQMIGQLPTEAISRMFEKRLTRYVNTLTAYVKEYGADKEFHQKIDTFLKMKNPNGDNAVANLIKELTNKIFAGEKVTTGDLLDGRAREAFYKTFPDEIEASDTAERKRREKIQNELDALHERLKAQKEVLQDKIKQLQEQIRCIEADENAAKENPSTLHQMKKELSKLESELQGVNDGLISSSSMPPEGDWEDMTIWDW